MMISILKSELNIEKSCTTNRGDKMMILKQDNLLEDEAETLVNTVNCVSVIGKGITLQFIKDDLEAFEHLEKVRDIIQRVEN